MPTTALAYETTNDLRAATTPMGGYDDGTVAYAYGNKYVWDGSSALPDNGGDGSGPGVNGGYAIQPTDRTSPTSLDGRWINQGKLLQLRDFAPGLTDGSANVGPYLTELFKYQSYLYLCEPFEKYKLTDVVEIPDGGGIVGVFPFAGPHGPGIPDPSLLISPGTPRFIIQDDTDPVNPLNVDGGFVATLQPRGYRVSTEDPIEYVDLPLNFAGIRMVNLVIEGGLTPIDTGLSHSCYFENVYLYNFSKVGLTMVVSEKNIVRNVWARIVGNQLPKFVPNTDPVPDPLPDPASPYAAFAFSDYQHSRYADEIALWHGAWHPTREIHNNVFFHRTEVSKCGTFVTAKVAEPGGTNIALKSAILINKEPQLDPVSTWDQIDVRDFLVRGEHQDNLVDGGGQIRATTFNGFHADHNTVGATETAFFSLDKITESDFQRVRDQTFRTTYLLKADEVDRVNFLECSFPASTIDITEVSGPVSFLACVGELTVGTPAISGVSFDGNFQIADTTVIGKTDISTTSGNVVWSPGGASAEAKSLEYLEQARTSLRAGFIKTGFTENTTSAVCTVTGLGGTITGRITVAVVRSGERAIGEYDFEGSFVASSSTLVQGSSGGGFISMSTTTSSGVHTVYVATNSFDGDLSLYVDVDLQGLNPDITVL